MKNIKNSNLARFLIFTFSIDIMLFEDFPESIQLQCLPSTLYVNIIALYISGVLIKRAYNFNDLYHTSPIDRPLW